MMIPIEDTYADVLAKAARGLGLDAEKISAETGVPVDAVKSLLDGQFVEEATAKVSKVLQLAPDRVVALGRGEYKPVEISPLKGFAAFNTPFQDMTVNSYLVWDSTSLEAVAFDTGCDCTDMLEALKTYGLTLKLILLTHSHGDHVFELDRLKEKTGAAAWIGEKEPLDGAESFAVGKGFDLGGLKISTRSTWGHSAGGVTYVVDGMQVPLAVVGDALFAGSMGGGGVSYDAALATNRANIFSLADETVLCPGHGPLTTVGEQKIVNPFYPEFSK